MASIFDQLLSQSMGRPEQGVGQSFGGLADAAMNKAKSAGGKKKYKSHNAENVQADKDEAARNLAKQQLIMSSVQGGTPLENIPPEQLHALRFNQEDAMNYQIMKRAKQESMDLSKAEDARQGDQDWENFMAQKQVQGMQGSQIDPYADWARKQQDPNFDPRVGY